MSYFYGLIALLVVILVSGCAAQEQASIRINSIDRFKFFFKQCNMVFG